MVLKIILDICQEDSRGKPPPTLYEYIPEDSLLFIDESHQTCGQIAGMYKGDFF